MQIIIPLSGLGKRFQDAGYKDIKPLIKVHEKSIIEWVVSLFPGNHEFIFICRQEHLGDTPLRSELNRIKPDAKIVAIEGHKLGPVYAVSKVFECIKDESEVIINYCDFFQIWDFEHFQNTVNKNQADAAIPCYTGLHPHLLHPENLYASCKKDMQGNLIEIREKFSFEQDKTKASHSGGTYYFAKGKYVKKYFQQLMDEKQDLNGEYYVSMVYNLLVKDNLNVLVYDDVKYFCQWGTPKDMEEYNVWMKIMSYYKRKESSVC
jgi:NDP-sugar pyrophosphorylase family protein